ncbi:beta-1,3-galactosyltransferase 1-like [Ambystoma mexicanum]|uniref:beta-1,3-galactosyltransferase 1-like n=1 Tax=Ambystoma mexicanum TaxID=8296 RepID=UPI0037E78BB8
MGSPSNKLRGFLCIMCIASATSILMVLNLKQSDVRRSIWQKNNTEPYNESRAVHSLLNTTVQPATTRHPLRPIYPYNYTFIFNQADKCREEAPFLILLVISKARDIEVRRAIRKTWGNESALPGVVIKRLFLIGMDPLFKAPLQAVLKEESLAHQDIVQQNFVDSYHNLTIKTMMGMEWVYKFCPNASYVLKIDTDVFLNIDFLVHDILKPKEPARKDYFTGRILANTGPIRNKGYWKWYIPEEIYPDKKYPPYCAGPSYLFSADVAMKVYNVAQLLPPFPMEDTFVGLCLREVGITITKPPHAVFHGYRVDYDRCKFYQLACVHPYKYKELLLLWPDFFPKNETGCKKKP